MQQNSDDLVNLVIAPNDRVKFAQTCQLCQITGVFFDDALKFLNALPDASLDEVYLLYPDPWPKTRHHKRRFVSDLTLSELSRTIRPGGLLHFATDIEDYANWTLANILRTPAFAFAPSEPGSWHQPYPGWAPTRYERKARAEGRMISWYFTFGRAA